MDQSHGSCARVVRADFCAQTNEVGGERGRAYARASVGSVSPFLACVFLVSHPLVRGYVSACPDGAPSFPRAGRKSKDYVQFKLVTFHWSMP